MYQLPAGESGTGRTTFVNTLCESDILAHKVIDAPENAHLEEGVRVKPVHVGASADISSYSTLTRIHRA